jgi:cytochrome c-type biogenesis protein CcmH/NrfF
MIRSSSQHGVRRLAAWVLGGMLLGVVALSPAATRAQSAKSSLKDPEQAAMFNRISDKLVCQCGCGEVLRVCNHFECPSAIPMRKKIEEQIVAGMSEQDIIAGFVSEYGKVVLASPPAEGIDLAAWVMPGFAVIIGLFLLLYIASDWVAKKKIKPAVETVPVDPSVVERIENELKGMDG